MTTLESRGANLLLGLLGALWLGVAATRQLNFDETLAVRAGFLLGAEAEGRPAFLMPWTAALGLAAHRVPRPFWLLVGLRLLVAGVVAGAWWRLLRRLEFGSWERLGVTVLLVTNGVFLSHGFELRYDSALLIGALAALALLLKGRAGVAFGVVLGLLALHHVKGLGLAVGLAALAWVGSKSWAVPRPNWKWILSSAAGVWLAWVASLASLGLLGRWLETVQEFGRQLGSATRAARSVTLGPVLLQDAAWWVLVTVGLGLALLRSAHESNQARLRLRLLAGTSFLGLLFWWLHPHPWAYLATLPAPFLLLAAWIGLREDPRALRLGAAAAGVTLLLQAAAGQPPGAAWMRAIRSPLLPQLELLERLREGLEPEDRVLDPTGLVYFARGCSREWYVDTLYAQRVARGVWMKELQRGVPEHCRVVVVTYRLAWLPSAAQETVRTAFQPFPCGLAWRRGHPVPEGVAALPGIGRIENYW